MVSVLVLGYGIEKADIAERYVDPINHIRAQDESLHVHGAKRMMEDNDWLTPKVMGRLFLFKPPLLLWLTAASMKLFGVSLFSIRLPNLILGAGGVAAVFFWVTRERSVADGIVASGVLLTSPFWKTFSQLCYTDIVACASALIALATAADDPRFDRRRTCFVFGVMGAASLLAKSVAGVLPFAALLLYCVLVRGQHPPVRRVVETLLIALVVFAPWHLYQMTVHPQWFWADYVQVQLLGIGFKDQPKQLMDAPIFFYLKRMMEMDPFLVLYTVIGLVGLCRLRGLRERPGLLLAVCWTLTTFAALCAFQARNLPYVVFLLPPLCLLGGMGGLRIRNWRWAAMGCGVLFLLKISAEGKVWAFESGVEHVTGVRAMRTYFDMHRDRQLISVDPDDEFYGLTIPLQRIRYCFVDPNGNVGKFAPHYISLGVVLTAQQFAELPILLPSYKERLRQWNVDSAEPVGAAITLRMPSDLITVIQAEPSSDYYLPSAWINEIAASQQTHELIPFSKDRVFLLSRNRTTN